MELDFEHDTRSRPAGGGAGTVPDPGVGERLAELPERWVTPWGGVNGGFAAGVAARAAVEAGRPRPPVSADVQFMRPARPGPARLQVERLWEGDHTALHRVRMAQDDGPVLDATVWSAEGTEELDHDHDPLPGLPPPDQLRPVPDLLAEEGIPAMPLWQALDVRPPTWASALHPPRRAPVERGWFRVLPPADLSDPGLAVAATLVAIDLTVVFPIWHPHGVIPALTGAAPVTLDLTAHFSTPRCEGPWLAFESSTPVAANGLVGGRASVWAPTGALVAHGTSQMLLLDAPPGV